MIHLSELSDKTISFEASFTRVGKNFCTVKNLHGSTLHLRGTGGTGKICEQLSVQVWDLKKQVNFLTGTVPISRGFV